MGLLQGCSSGGLLVGADIFGKVVKRSGISPDWWFLWEKHLLMCVLGVECQNIVG